MGTVTGMVRKAEDRKDVSWATMKGWDVDRQESERRIADALQVKLDKLGEKEWLAQCKKEMGWGERAAYYHLRPETLAKKREGDKARQAAARVVQVEPEPVEPEAVKDWTKIDGFGRTIKTPPNQPADGLTTLLDGFNQSLTTLEWNMKRGRVTAENIEQLEKIWDRLGALIERWGADQADAEARSNPRVGAEVEPFMAGGR